MALPNGTTTAPHSHRKSCCTKNENALLLLEMPPDLHKHFHPGRKQKLQQKNAFLLGSYSKRKKSNKNRAKSFIPAGSGCCVCIIIVRSAKTFRSSRPFSGCANSVASIRERQSAERTSRAFILNSNPLPGIVPVWVCFLRKQNQKKKPEDLDSLRCNFVMGLLCRWCWEVSLLT